MYKTFTIQADKASDIVQIISDQLKTNIDKENNEICLNIPSKLGSGHIRSIEFENGVSLVEVDVLLNKSFKLTIEKKAVNPLVLLFNTQNDLIHLDSKDETKNKIKKFESLMFSNDMKDSNTIVIESGKPVCFIKILINRRDFESKICDFLDSMSVDLETIFQDLNGVKLFNYKGFYSLETAEAIDQIKNTEKEGLSRAMLIESRIYDIVSSQIEQFTDDEKEPQDRQILRKSTIEKLEEAAELIKNELDTTMSVNQIAKHVGLNQNTLQLGFQKLFDCSVNDYIKSKRLIKAKELIESSQLNLTEISYAVGINSRSYFSKLFKDKYQMTPNSYLKKVRKSKSA